MKKEIICLLFASLISFCACRRDNLDPDHTDNPVLLDLADWTEETHGHLEVPNYALVFKQEEVLRFDIEISSENWATMQTDLASQVNSGGGLPPGVMGGISSSDPVWVPCSVYFNDTQWYQVGIRYKGNSSLRSTYQMGLEKFSFKLDFDQYEEDYPQIENQRFYGFKQLNLKNNYDDASMMREKVGADLFRDFGLPSPQAAFCVVYVNHGSGPIYYGIYTLVEEVDDTVPESQFGTSEGNLYKPDGPAASFAAGSFNEVQMEKKNNEELADYSDVLSLYTTLNSADRTADSDAWKSSLAAVFDVDGFLQWLAANTAMQNWDTYGRMTHNYYLYNNPSDGLLTWIPWDNNEALQEGKQGGALSLSLEEVGSTWPLIRYLMDLPEYKAQYQEYLLSFDLGVFAPEEMIALYSQYYDLLKEYAYSEARPYSFLRSSTEFDVAVEQLKEHVQTRHDAVMSYLAK